MMCLLTFVLFIVAVFVGKGRGVALWLFGSAGIIFAFNYQAEVVRLYSELYQYHQLPILLTAIAVDVIAICISRWRGLLFHLVGSVAVFLVALATMQIHCTIQIH